MSALVVLNGVRCLNNSMVFSGFFATTFSAAVFTNHLLLVSFGQYSAGSLVLALFWKAGVSSVFLFLCYMYC